MNIICNTLKFYNCNSILSGSATNDVTGSMLDMEGRKSAVEIMEKMATSFARADVPDPNKILDFVETSTASVAAVFEVGSQNLH